MSATKQKKSDAGWKALALIGAILLVCGYGILFVPDVREVFHLSREPVFSFSKLFSGGGAKRGGPAQRRQAAKIPREELESFVSSFIDREVEVVVLPREEGEQLVVENAEERAERIASLWEIRVSGTFTDLDRNWLAIINRQYCKVGRRIESAVEGRCAYQILGVGKTCVWMVAYDKARDGEPPHVPDVLWPDVSFIVNERVNGLLKPAKVRFARGAEVREGQFFKVSRESDVTFRVAKLFEHGACFEMKRGKDVWLLGCMVVAP